MWVFVLKFIIERFSVEMKSPQSPFQYLYFFTQAAENRIELMKRTVDELKSCKTGLCWPEGAENTLTVFSRADLLLNKLLELEQVSTHTYTPLLTHPDFVIGIPWVSKSVV